MAIKIENINGFVFVGVGFLGGAISDFAWWKIAVAALAVVLSFVGAKVTRPSNVAKPEVK